MALIRFCSECNQERTDTSWSESFSRRLCIDCFNLICEGLDRAEPRDASDVEAP